MHNARLRFGLEVHGDNGTIEEARGNAVAIWAGADGYAEVLLREAGLTFVCLKVAHLDFSVGEADDELAVALIWPGHAGDRGALGELVADSLLIAPLAAKTVDEDDAVGLGDGELL